MILWEETAMVVRPGWMGAGLGAAMVMAAMVATAANAGTKGGLYDMKAMINEGHPFAAPYRGLAPAAMAPAHTMTPIAPPPPTLRYTPPPRPVAQDNVVGGKASPEPYQPFGESMDSGWFNRFYISTGVSLNLPADQDGRTAAGAAYSVELDPGFVIQGAIGTYLWSSFRIEAEAAFRMADYDQATAGGTKVTPTGDLKIATGMINYFYDPDLDLGAFKPYLGAGLGVAQIKSAALTIGNLTVAKKDATEFAYQAIIGVTYEFSRDWSIGLDGRYLGTSDENVSAAGVTLNLRYNL